MSLYVFAFLATLSVFVAAKDASFCNLASCKGKPNSGCLYSPNEVSRACGKHKPVGLSRVQIDEILHVHNKVRDLVASGQERRGNPGPQPPVKGKKAMPHLVWSNTLASVAQSWANQCQWGHDPCRNTPKGSIGQNIAESAVYGQAPKSLTQMMMGWYDEVKDFDGRSVAHFNPNQGAMIGHYTQMVWAETTEIGCGLIEYQNQPPWENKYLVCNYGPAGNMIGAQIYPV